MGEGCVIELREEFKIECEECEAITFITSEDSPEFCPMCGRRSHAVTTREFDYVLEEDEDV